MIIQHFTEEKSAMDFAETLDKVVMYSFNSQNKGLIFVQDFYLPAEYDELIIFEK